MIEITPSAKSTYPGAKFGVMIVKGFRAATGRSAMEQIIAAELEQIKSKHPDYDRKTALEAEPLCHYTAYYKRFKKTYPVLGQLESVLLKGKGIPPVGISVEAMFLAEIKNLLLTAGHDLVLIKGGLTVDVATEPTSYEGISGKEQQLVKDDLYLSDEKGILSSIMNGPDYRTQITEATQNALYFVYGVEGVTETQIREHLQTISSYLSQAVQGIEVQSIKVL
jgi:DNA/RNA-binding domain of Phe-tRNA-synthetase-like protein